MRGEPGVLDYLNKALRHELTAIKMLRRCATLQPRQRQ
jgi:bacterioferritin (cytochrome b1)